MVFRVHGKCEPQGSSTAFVPTDKRGQPFRRAGGSIVVNVTSDNPALKGWRAKVEAAARAAYRDPVIEGISLGVQATFFLKRPEGHWGTGRNAGRLKDSAPARPITIPDHDKLLRAVLDGMTGIVYHDDSLVTASFPRKVYAVPGNPRYAEGVLISVFAQREQFASGLTEDQRVRPVLGEQVSLATV